MVKFPWRSIWHCKVAWDVAFFLFAQQPWPKLLPRIIWLNRISFYWIGVVTCLCNCSGKATICLLIHSTVAKDLWSFLFMLLGVKWVTSWQVGFFFFFGKECLKEIEMPQFRACPALLMWNVWTKRNSCTFNGIELSTSLHSLYECSNAFGHACSLSIVHFLHNILFVIF